MPASLKHHSIKAYSKTGLSIYDRLVMGWLAKYVWGCSADNFIAFYRTHMSANHAEIGVGTGYCIDRCGLELPNRRLALIDLQKNCLDYAERRLARFTPTTHIRDVRHPITIDANRFDSIALGGVLHCLSGDMREKGRVFDALRPIAKRGTTIFGYTLVADRVSSYSRRRLAQGFLNRVRVIDNRNDRFEALRHELEKRFDNPQLKLTGSMAFFSAVMQSD